MKNTDKVKGAMKSKKAKGVEVQAHQSKQGGISVRIFSKNFDGRYTSAQYKLSHPAFCQVTINDHHLEDILWPLPDPLPPPAAAAPPVAAAAAPPPAGGVGVGAGAADLGPAILHGDDAKDEAELDEEEAAELDRQRSLTEDDADAAAEYEQRMAEDCARDQAAEDGVCHWC